MDFFPNFIPERGPWRLHSNSSWAVAQLSFSSFAFCTLETRTEQFPPPTRHRTFYWLQTCCTKTIHEQRFPTSREAEWEREELKLEGREHNEGRTEGFKWQQENIWCVLVGEWRREVGRLSRLHHVPAEGLTELRSVWPEPSSLLICCLILSVFRGRRTYANQRVVCSFIIEQCGNMWWSLSDQTSEREREKWNKKINRAHKHQWARVWFPGSSKAE